MSVNKASVIVLELILIAGPAYGAIVTGPYLQNSRPSAMTVMWETDVAGQSWVDYGPTASYGSTAGQADSVTLHSVNVSGLSPATVYHYRVRTGATTSADCTMMTAPAKGTSGFSFFAYGDSRTAFYVHEEVIQSMLLVGRDWRTLVFNSGDLVTADTAVPADWQREFFNPLRDLISMAPIYVGRGNHEGSNSYFLTYLAPPDTSGSGSEYYYSLDYGDVHFVVLDTEQAYGSGSAQYTWLQTDLAAASDSLIDWIVVCFHTPPYSTGNHASDLNVRAAFHPLFMANGVDLVINGHDHDYERTVQQDGVVYIVAGGGGAGLYTQSVAQPWSAIFKSWHHFCTVDVSKDALTVRAYAAGVDGYKNAELYDSVVIKKSGGWGPSAVAHPDAIVTAGSPVMLNGTLSFDPDGQPITYQWTQLSGPAVTLNGPTTSQPSFTPVTADVYRFKLATNDGTVESAPDTVTITVEDASTAKVTLNPLEDAWVSSGTPATNYGTGVLNVDGEADIEVSYLKFNIPAPPGGKQLLYATLKLHCTNNSDDGGYIRTTSVNSWAEGTLTYSNRPLPDGPITGSIPLVALDTDYIVDVTGAVKGPGLLTLVLLPSSSDGADYSSREDSTYAPVLTLAYYSGPVDGEPPTVSPTSCAITGRVDDAGSVPVIVMVDGSPVSVTGNDWTTEVPLTSSPKTVNIQTSDASGNTRAVVLSLTW